MNNHLIVEKGSKWVMIGDSISDCNRARPYGEGILEGIGNGYIGLVDALLKIQYHKAGIRIINMGVNGNTSRHLLDRWEKDVLDLKPDWISILVGANDVWRQFDSPLMSEHHVLEDEYESNLRKMIEMTIPNVKGILMLTPYYMELNLQDQMRIMMDKYREIVINLACTYDLPYVDLQEEFDAYFKNGYYCEISWDRIHPNLSGHMLIAKAILNRIGFEWK